MFTSSIIGITQEQSKTLLHSGVWKEACPIPLDVLCLLSVSFWDFDGVTQQGNLMVHKDAAQDLLRVFETLHEVRFPIRRMNLVTRYHGDDNASMEDDNTSAFNGRMIAGTDRWSQHAYGTAVDINPIENPQFRDGVVDPPEGVAFFDRSVAKKGMIMPGDVVVRAFADIGWSWGGDWTSFKDYMHFSKNGS